MKINYFEVKVVDSGTNLPELKHSSKRQTNSRPHIYQAACFPLFCHLVRAKAPHIFSGAVGGCFSQRPTVLSVYVAGDAGR